MRVLSFLILLLVVVGVIIFAVQNNETVTLNFLGRSLSISLSMLTVAVYLLGMVSGWTVVGFLRRSLRRATETRKE